MGLVSWLNRTVRTSILSAPQAAMASGAEGVSVMPTRERNPSDAKEVVEASLGHDYSLKRNARFT